MTSLKLVALDEEDLKVFSAHLQDAILRVEDIAWQPAARRFVAIVNRFNWEKALDAEAEGKEHLERGRAAVRFDKVDSVQLRNITIGKHGQVLELLAVAFHAGELPGGWVELIFADDCAIRLNVECIEAELTDLGQGWQARSKPQHG